MRRGAVHRVVYGSEDVADRVWRGPAWARPAAGGVLLGLLLLAVRVLVLDGRIRARELRRWGLTDNDLLAQLRQMGVFDLEELRHVLYETKGC